MTETRETQLQRETTVTVRLESQTRIGITTEQ
jgi:hypothetical protein